MNKIEKVFLIVLVAISAFLRIYRFKDFMEFLGDQGRDAIIAKQILIDHHPTLLGPGTSVGSMYLGPLYYYFMVPFLAVTYPDPVGPALGVSILGILTVAFLYLLGRDIVGKKGAGIASILLATSPIAVKLSRFSWQPNPAPFVGLVMLWFTYKAWKGKTWYWVGAWISFVVLTQLHYVALLSVFPAGVLFLYDIYRNRKMASKRMVYFKILCISAAVFLFSLLPLAIFDIRHENIVRKGFVTFIQERQQKVMTPIQKVSQMYQDSHGVGMKVILETLGISKQHRTRNTYLLYGVIAATVFSLVTARKKKDAFSGVAIVSLWVFITVIGLVYYRDTIYDHYYAFAFPAIFLLIGYLLSRLTKTNIFVAVGVYVLLLVGAFSNITSMGYWKERPYGVYDVKNVVDLVLPNINHGEAYNVTLLNDNREYMGMKYRYFLEVSDKKPKTQYDYQHLDKLVIIVENGESPLDAPIYEVQEFKREVKSPVLEKQLTYNGVVNIYIYTRP